MKLERGEVYDIEFNSGVSFEYYILNNSDIFNATFNINDDCIDISFPDLKGCFTFGENLEVALKMSKEALEGYLLTLEDEKIYIGMSVRVSRKNFIVRYKCIK